MKVSVNDKETAVVRNGGRLTAGDVLLFVRSSTPMQISRLSISGVPSPVDPQQNRDRCVAAVIDRLWR